MLDTIESTHNKIIEKIVLIKSCLESIKKLVAGVNSQEVNRIYVNLTIDKINTVESNYNLSIVSVLGNYYQNSENESENTKEYYRILISENFMTEINDIISDVKASKNLLGKLSPDADIINCISKDIERAENIEITMALEKRNYEICKCGTRMNVVPELSELHCTNPACGKIKTIIGAVFRDDQFYPQEGQKTKHGGYDTSRHYRFWIERLQALENKTFDKKDLDKIEYVIKRDGYNRHELTCEIMREILKDSKVGATKLNDHAPLLVKLFGGPSPPQLDFYENRMASIRFNKVMKLYDIVNPNGGNKPYYPYFIYKILENMFEGKPNKLKILDSVHLQSRETIIKNDGYYEQICSLSDESDGIKYKATPMIRIIKK